MVETRDLWSTVHCTGHGHELVSRSTMSTIVQYKEYHAVVPTTSSTVLLPLEVASLATVVLLPVAKFNDCRSAERESGGSSSSHESQTESFGYISLLSPSRHTLEE